MSELVNSADIEKIVGVPRHQTRHYARAVSRQQTVYILHSHECLTSSVDLRKCPYSLALDHGIDIYKWIEDEPVQVQITGGLLVPVAPGKDQ